MFLRSLKKILREFRVLSVVEAIEGRISPQRHRERRDSTEEYSLCNLRVLCVSVMNTHSQLRNVLRIKEREWKVRFLFLLLLLTSLFLTRSGRGLQLGPTLQTPQQ